MIEPLLVSRADEERVVRILWDDDHLSEYPWAYLRGWCPCALCQGHGGQRRFVHVERAELSGWTQVGNYAINFFWTDGHQTGIYSYDYLRALCACSECRPRERAQEEDP